MWPWVLLGVVVLFFGGCTALVLIGTSSDSSKLSRPGTITKDGIYTVGKDIQPGTWESDDPDRSCMWTLFGPTHEGGVDLGGAAAGGPISVRILPSDTTFSTTGGCRTWHKIG